MSDKKLLDDLKNCDNCVYSYQDEYCLNSPRKACKKYTPDNKILLKLIEDLYKKLNKEQA